MDKAPHVDSTVDERTLLQVMLDHWVHEDRLFWDQFRYLVTLQFAFVAAWYALGPSLLGAALMWVTVLVIGLLWQLANTIRLNRDVNVETLMTIASLANNPKVHPLQEDTDDQGSRPQAFRFASHPLGSKGDVGMQFQNRLFCACLVFNLVLAGVSTYDQFSDPGGALLGHVHPRFDRQEVVAPEDLSRPGSVTR